MLPPAVSRLWQSRTISAVHWPLIGLCHRHPPPPIGSPFFPILGSSFFCSRDLPSVAVNTSCLLCTRFSRRARSRLCHAKSCGWLLLLVSRDQPAARRHVADPCRGLNTHCFAIITLSFMGINGMAWVYSDRTAVFQGSYQASDPCAIPSFPGMGCGNTCDR